jgi:ubiquitin-protein ligase
MFEFVLGKGFPLTVPKLYLKTGLFQPFVNDFRDLMHDVLQEPWSYKIKVAGVVGKLDGFLQRLCKDAQNPLVMQKLGRYYLGEKFTLAELSEFKPVDIFQAFKLETDRIVMHYLAVS